MPAAQLERDHLLAYYSAREERQMRLTGPQLVRLMRRHRVTIKQLASRMQITMKQVRKARAEGKSMPGRIGYEEAIVGEYTPRMRAQMLQWRNWQEEQLKIGR